MVEYALHVFARRLHCLMLVFLIFGGSTLHLLELCNWLLLLRILVHDISGQRLTDTSAFAYVGSGWWLNHTSDLDCC